MNFTAKLIRITPYTNRKSGERFWNYGWATMSPVAEAVADQTAEEVAELVAAGIDLDKTAVFSITENTQILPATVLGHVFELENVRLVLAMNEDKTPAKHKDGSACLNGTRSSATEFPVYSWVAVGGSTARGIPAQYLTPAAVAVPAEDAAVALEAVASVDD